MVKGDEDDLPPMSIDRATLNNAITRFVHHEFFAENMERFDALIQGWVDASAKNTEDDAYVKALLDASSWKTDMHRIIDSNTHVEENHAKTETKDVIERLMKRPVAFWTAMQAESKLTVDEESLVEKRINLEKVAQRVLKSFAEQETKELDKDETTFSTALRRYNRSVTKGKEMLLGSDTEKRNPSDVSTWTLARKWKYVLDHRALPVLRLLSARLTYAHALSTHPTIYALLHLYNLSDDNHTSRTCRLEDETETTRKASEMLNALEDVFENAVDDGVLNSEFKRWLNTVLKDDGEEKGSGERGWER